MDLMIRMILEEEKVVILLEETFLDHQVTIREINQIII